MKKKLALVLCAVLVLCLAAGCHVTKTETHTVTENGVTTTTTTTTVDGKTTTTTEVLAPTCAQAAEDGEIHTADFILHNTSEEERTIIGLYVAPAGSDNWSDNLLSGEPLETGAVSANSTLNYNQENLVWDFGLEDSEGLKIRFEGVDISEYPNDTLELFFTYKGNDVWNIRG